MRLMPMPQSPKQPYLNVQLRIKRLSIPKYFGGIMARVNTTRKQSKSSGLSRIGIPYLWLKHPAHMVHGRQPSRTSLAAKLITTCCCWTENLTPTNIVMATPFRSVHKRSATRWKHPVVRDFFFYSLRRNDIVFNSSSTKKLTCQNQLYLFSQRAWAAVTAA